MSNALPSEAIDTSAPALVRQVHLRAKRYALWMRHLWQQGLGSADQGLAITHGEVIRKILPHLQLSADPPPMAPARVRQEACAWSSA